MRGSLDLLISLANSAISLLIYVFDLLVDVSDVPLDLVNAVESVIVALIFGHAFEVLAVQCCHLLFVILAVAIFGLDHCFDLLADAPQLDVTIFCQIALRL